MPTSARACTSVLLQIASNRALRRGDSFRHGLWPCHLPQGGRQERAAARRGGTSGTPSPTVENRSRTPCRGRRPRRPVAGTIISRFCVRNSQRLPSRAVGADAHIRPCWHFCFAANRIETRAAARGLLPSRPLAVPPPSRREARSRCGAKGRDERRNPYPKLTEKSPKSRS